jgi:hypothetical protein
LGTTAFGGGGVTVWGCFSFDCKLEPAVLNGRCRARLDMSWSSLGVVLRGLPARGRSVTFPFDENAASVVPVYTHTYLPVKQVIDRFLFMCI